MITLGMTKKEIMELSISEKDYEHDIEIYYGDIHPSARENIRLKDKTYKTDDIIEQVHSLGFKANILLNLFYLSKSVDSEELLDYLHKYWDKADSFTIAPMQLLFKLMSEGFPTKERIKISTVRELRTERDIEFFGNYVHSIVLSTQVTRNIRWLQKLRSKCKLEILVNESCVLDCALRGEHFCIETENIETEGNFPFSYCNNLLFREGYNSFLKETSFILPSIIKQNHLDRNFDIKLSTRILSLDRKLKILDYYDKGINPEFVFEVLPHVFNLSTEGKMKDLHTNDVFWYLDKRGVLQYKYKLKKLD